jgi:hypothetical protein
MDPFTISTGIAGFLSLAIEITKILSTFISDAKSAHADAQLLLSEVESLCTVLEQFAKFLRYDFRGAFTAQSALYAAVIGCQHEIQTLSKKLEKLQRRGPGDGKVREAVKKVVNALEWPFRKEEYDGTLARLKRFEQTFVFAMTVANWWFFCLSKNKFLMLGSHELMDIASELLSKTSDVVFEWFEENRGLMKKNIAGFEAMQLPIDGLMLAAQKQEEKFAGITKSIQLGTFSVPISFFLCAGRGPVLASKKMLATWP